MAVGVLDERRLTRELGTTFCGEVRFSKRSRALYSTDAFKYRQLPIGVVIPRHTEDVVAALAVCREPGAPVLACGAGTVQPALILDHLCRETETGSPRLTFGPDPATHDHCTPGGMIGNNSCGVHSVMSAFYGAGGRTSDNVVSLEILTYDGVRPEVGPLARLARAVPRLTNLVAETPPLSAGIKRLAGVAPERTLLQFAHETFHDWFRARGPARTGAEVMLRPDTFTNHFHPEVGRADVEFLGSAGFRATLPPRPLWCGRPLYDRGMRDLSKRLLRQILETLRPQIRRRVPLVALEPSCLDVFRDELVELLPLDADARRLRAQSFSLAELLERTDGYDPPRLAGSALLHGHCHQKAVVGLDAEQALLAREGLAVECPDSGCCAMAGAFGFDRGDHYDVSIAAGERVLLPVVRRADARPLILADGFSCGEQIRQQTDRQALHLAQVLQEGRARGVERA